MPGAVGDRAADDGQVPGSSAKSRVVVVPAEIERSAAVDDSYPKADATASYSPGSNDSWYLPWASVTTAAPPAPTWALATAFPLEASVTVPVNAPCSTGRTKAEVPSGEPRPVGPSNPGELAHR